MQVIAKSNIKHDGVVYEKGASLEVSDKQAADLLAAGVIEKVDGVKPSKPEPAVAEKTLGEASDKSAEKAGIEEVANMPVSMNMTKEKLVGVARAMGLKVEKSALRNEVYAMIKEARNEKADESGEDETNESATGGAESTEPKVPANPEENAPAQNTTDTEKEPAPKGGKTSKSK